MSLTVPPIDTSLRIPDYLEQAIEALVEILRETRNGIYFVKTGPIIWEAFPFDQYRRGISVGVDHSQLFGRGGEGCSTPESVISLEMASRMGTTAQEQVLDTGLMAEFRSDAREALFRLMGLQNAEGDHVILRFDYGSAIAEEFASADLAIQGLLVQFVINV